MQDNTVACIVEKKKKQKSNYNDESEGSNYKINIKNNFFHKISSSTFNRVPG
jgi:hypothetical protein